MYIKRNTKEMWVKQIREINGWLLLQKMHKNMRNIGTKTNLRVLLNFLHSNPHQSFHLFNLILTKNIN